MDKGQEIKSYFTMKLMAFDIVWIGGLIFKLRKYGINATILSWFKRYLTYRKQRALNEVSFPKLGKYIRSGATRFSA